MQEFYLWIVVLLFILAITDLMVGVSNDAVNFLNSAIGAKVAPFKTILIVATLGIIVGATFSSGIMEVARRGIFNPDMFTYGSIIIIFLAVMLTDVIMLDLFNTLGLPTSTTVSIVFELLGAAVAVAFLLTMTDGGGLGEIVKYINTSKALTIIMGIFLSIGVAFVIGWALQFLARVVYTFDYEKKLKVLGGITGGIAACAFTYFMLLKGLKGASFISPETATYIKGHTFTILTSAFVVGTVVFQLISLYTKINIFKIIVLVGTFSLAMAFASNDLVNFIGVPIASMKSYVMWSQSGLSPDQFMMDGLLKPVQTNTYLLLAAGLIMAATLWLSKKARGVTETSINLGRQDEGAERFQPNAFSRGLVTFFTVASNGVKAVIPGPIRRSVSRSFEKKQIVQHKDELKDKPAFDMIRAAVNLTVASALIGFATSLKLPLSTTYVTFMVAMGASLADRAWGRESAVYRVSGVVTVVSGWFMTAFIAFTAAAIVATLLWYFEMYALVGMVALVIFSVYKTTTYHKRQREEKESQAQVTEWLGSGVEPVVQAAILRIKVLNEKLKSIHHDSVAGLVNNDKISIKRAKREVEALRENNNLFRHEIIRQIKSIEGDHRKTSKILLAIYDLEQNLTHNIENTMNTCRNHLINLHNLPEGEAADKLLSIDKHIADYMDLVYSNLARLDGVDISQIKEVKKNLLDRIESAIETDLHESQDIDKSVKDTILHLTVLLESKELVILSTRFTKLFKKLRKSIDEPVFDDVLEAD